MCILASMGVYRLMARVAVILAKKAPSLASELVLVPLWMCVLRRITTPLRVTLACARR